MGTTLTGTTPQDTYDSLIKVTDNGPLGATNKLLTDGLGNDSAFYLGTAGVAIKATSVLSFNGPSDTTHSVGYDSVIDGSQLRGQNGVRFSTGSGSGTERMRITSTGNVGIGTTAPTAILDVRGAATQFRVGISAGGFVELSDNQVAAKTSAAAASDLYLNVSGANTILNRDSGNVGIGLSNPVQKFGVSDGSNALYVTHDANGPYIQAVNNANTVYKRQTYDAIDHVFLISASERARFTSNGLTFNGDTAAANALDDYEEGTFTPSVIGTSGAATYTTREGYYTKIGRQVTINWFISFQKNTLSGSIQLASLPFTVANLTNHYPQAIIMLDNLASAYDNPLLQLEYNSTIADIIINNGSTISRARMQDTQLGAGTMAFGGTATYFV